MKEDAVEGAAHTPTRAKPRMRRALRLAALPVIAYVAVVAALYFLQGGMLFFPQATELSDGQRTRALEVDGAEELSVEVEDGVSLHGFLLPGQGGGARPTVLYFGGNAESTGNATGQHSLLRARGWNVVLVAYRGYGRSRGDPSGAALLSDALVLYDRMAARPDVDASRIVTWGRSLGSGVATHVAAHRDVVGVVLVSPYTRLSDAAGYHYPWLPVSLLFRHEIDSLSAAPTIDTPALFLHGTDDEVIPHEQSAQLAAAWRPTPRVISLDGYGHNDVDLAPSFDQEIVDFIDAPR